MIVVDTSALIAIVLHEADAVACREALAESRENLVSAGTLSEAMIVAAGRGVRDELQNLVSNVHLSIVDVTGASSIAVADAYRRWGRGFHKASLNFGDCFAYALAAERKCPLLYVGKDFAQTDIASAIPASA